MTEILKIGDLVTYGFNGDCYPAKVIRTSESGKTVWVEDVPYVVVARLDGNVWTQTNDYDINDYDYETMVEFGTQIRVKFFPELVQTSENKGRRFYLNKKTKRYLNGYYTTLYPGLRYSRNAEF